MFGYSSTGSSDSREGVRSQDSARFRWHGRSQTGAGTSASSLQSVHDLVASQLHHAQQALEAEHARALNILSTHLHSGSMASDRRNQVGASTSVHDSAARSYPSKAQQLARQMTLAEAVVSSIQSASRLGRGKSTTEDSPRSGKRFERPPPLSSALAPGGPMQMAPPPLAVEQDAPMMTHAISLPSFSASPGAAVRQSQRPSIRDLLQENARPCSAKDKESNSSFIQSSSTMSSTATSVMQPGMLPLQPEKDAVSPPSAGPDELVPLPSGEAPRLCGDCESIGRSTGVRPSRLSENSAESEMTTHTMVDQEMPAEIARTGSSEQTASDKPLEVLPFWLQNHHKGYARQATNASRTGQVRTLRTGSSLMDISQDILIDEADDKDDRYKGCLAKFLILPNSAKRTTWDLFSLCLVSYDIFYLPMRFFELKETPFVKCMVWITRFFWTFDMYASMITGFLKPDGDIEMRPVKIWMRYLKTWFFLDLLIVASDWLELIWSGASSGGFARMGRASRVLRFIRIMRLLRLLRLSRVLSATIERLQSEVMTIFANIVKIIMSILCMAHVFGCVWYGLGVQQDQEGNVVTSWATQFDPDFLSRPLGFRYAASLHWSLCQFSGGMDEMVPTTTLERVYTLFVYMLFYITAVLFVSGLTAAMTRLDMLSSEQQSKLAVLRRYLRGNKVPKRLAVRVQQNAKHMLQLQRHFVPEGKVELLQMISKPLMVEIHFQTYSTVLSMHPFFERYIHWCPAMMRQGCHRAISPNTVVRDDIIFSAGEMPSNPHAYIISSGVCSYISLDGEVSVVTKDMWMAEAALWTFWLHRGTCYATSESQLLHLDTQTFQKTVKQFDHPDFSPTAYAINFVKSLNEKCASDDLFSGLEVQMDYNECLVNRNSRWTSGRGDSHASDDNSDPGKGKLGHKWMKAKGLVKQVSALRKLNNIMPNNNKTTALQSVKGSGELLS